MGGVFGLLNTKHTADVNGTTTHRGIVAGTTTHDVNVRGSTTHTTTSNVDLSGGQPHVVKFGVTGDVIFFGILSLVVSVVWFSSHDTLEILVRGGVIAIVALVCMVYLLVVKIREMENEMKSEITTLRAATQSEITTQIAGAHTKITSLENKLPRPPNIFLRDTPFGITASGVQPIPSAEVPTTAVAVKLMVYVHKGSGGGSGFFNGKIMTKENGEVIDIHHTRGYCWDQNAIAFDCQSFWLKLPNTENQIEVQWSGTAGASKSLFILGYKE
eukprot:m.18254 g.18254  ORF g.18254 m.18254 type:complete len:272 (-) comp11917_c0_seq1:86-901(-)